MGNVEDFVGVLLTQLLVIIVLAQVGGWLFRWLGQPRVVGEILAGLLLGPSCLGVFFPVLLQNLFPSAGDQSLRVLGQIGLVLLMFDVGLSFDFSHWKTCTWAAVGVAAAGIALPFGFGLMIASAMAPTLASGVPSLPFSLFVATAMSITAIPILGRIMMDLKMESTAIGVLTISAAAIDDAVGWVVLAIVSGLVTGGLVTGELATLSVDWMSVVGQFGGLALFLLGSFWWFRPIAGRLVAKCDWDDPRHAPALMAALITLVFAFAIVTNGLGVFSVFGPFVLGACLSGQGAVAAFYKRSASPLVAAFLLPVFFTFTGLRTDIGTLDGTGWLWCAAVFVVACAGKLLGCGLAARLAGYPWRDAGVVAVMMNTRALMGLVAINVGRELGVIPDQVFSMLVVMAIGTTVMTVPLLKLLKPAIADAAAKR